jgi:predicted permease
MGRKFPGLKRVLRIEKPVRDQVKDDVAAEIRFHIQSRVEELVAGGRSHDEARRQATREFGDSPEALQALKSESTRTVRHTRRRELLDRLEQDVRYGWRTLRGSPGFAATTILTLALAIGANTAIFSVVRAVILRPLPYPEPDRLVAVWEHEPGGNPRNNVTDGSYLDWRDGSTRFQELGAFSWEYDMALAGDGPPVQLSVIGMTADAFRALGLPPKLGRSFSEEEMVPGGARTVVISHGLWQRRFGGDPEVVGKTIRLDDIDRMVIGVMGPEFAFPTPDVDLWGPLQLTEADRENRRAHRWRVIGRLKPGAQIEQAQAELSAIASRLATEYPEWMEGWDVNVQPYRSDLTAQVRTLMWLLLGVVAVVLLIACANIANLLLARAVGREREVAVRGALGAGRTRLIRQFLTESALIAVLGGAIGFALATAGIDLFVALAPDDIPLLEDTRIDFSVFGFASLAILASTVLFGLIPAVRATGVDFRSTLASGLDRSSGGVPHARLRSSLLVSQVALTLMLLIGAGLLVRSFIELERVDYGYEPERLLAVQMNLPTSRYGDMAAHARFYEPLIERVEALPGVQSVVGTSEPPVIGYGMTWSFAIESKPREGLKTLEDDVQTHAVTPGYFQTLGIPVRAGRAFQLADRDDAPLVAVINESLAQQHWPGSAPNRAIGERIAFQDRNGPWIEIVGVVGDVRQRGSAREPAPAIYLPWSQRQWAWMSWMTLLVRLERELAGSPLSLTRPIEAAMWELDDQVPIQRVGEVSEFYAESTARRRFAMNLLGAFAGLALLLGVVGIYGVLSYTVAQRRHEIGIRMALGAGQRSVATSVVGQGLRLACLGVAIGVVGALALTRLLQSLLYEVGATDLLTFVALPLGLLAVAALAAYLPARRASRIEPTTALRAG